MIDGALQTWNHDAEAHKPEIARTTFLKAKLLQRLGETLKARATFTAVSRLRKELLPGDIRDVATLEARDFDKLLTFWSR